MTNTQNTKSNLFVYILVVMGGILIFLAPLVHMEFPKKNKKVEIYKAELRKEYEMIKAKLIRLEISYKTASISAEDYIVKSKLIDKELQIKEQKNNRLIDAMSDSERIFDWKTMRIFLLGLGIRLPYLLFSILISYFIKQLGTKDKNLSRAYDLLQISCYAISLYLLIWVFWPAQDFPLAAYRWAIIVTCFLAAIGCSYFIRYYESNVARMKSKIRYIMNLMVKQAVDQGHIKDEQRYDDEIVYPALRKLDE